MKAVFNHEQEFFPKLDGACVDNRKELFALFEMFKDQEPFIGHLVGDNGYKLALGIGKELGCVQHSSSNGDVPYLVALAPGIHGEDDYFDFWVGNTPTPIHKRYCLPFETVKEIAAYFIETGERSSDVSWEEI
jgi:immunity protein Imm1 of predicted polymorphic toxin system